MRIILFLCILFPIAGCNKMKCVQGKPYTKIDDIYIETTYYGKCISAEDVK